MLICSVLLVLQVCALSSSLRCKQLTLVDRTLGTGWILPFYPAGTAANLVHEAFVRDPQEFHGMCNALTEHNGLLTRQQWTDSRARLLRELLGTMQIIKVFTYEIPFLKRT